MNSCCDLPVGRIAMDKHKVGESCCLVTEKTQAPVRAECPVSHTLSRKVQHRTVEHMLKPEKAASLRSVQYYYCTDPSCNIVYFSAEDVPHIVKDNVAVKVFAKDQGNDVNVCYCFGWSRDRVKRQIAEGGKSTAAMEIAREVKAGNCACDIKNPKGECCLGEVLQVVKEAMRSSGR